jgi:hypothetical protein
MHVLEDIVHLELYGEGGRPLQEGEFAHEVYCTGMWNRVTPGGALRHDRPHPAA